MPLQTRSQKPQTPKKTAKPKPKPKAIRKAGSAAKTPIKKKFTAPIEITQAYENGAQEITLQFSAPGKSIWWNVQSRNRWPILYEGESQLPTTPKPDNQTDRHVVFDLTPSRASPDILTPNQRASPWLNSPSDPNPFAPRSTTGHTENASSAEDFTYVFRSPLTPSRPTQQSHTSNLTPATSRPDSPITPHCNHGFGTPRAGAHSQRPQSQSPPIGPAGNRHGKEAGDVQPFFELDERRVRKICLLCR